MSEREKAETELGFEYECACCQSRHDSRDSPPVPVQLLNGKKGQLCAECAHSQFNAVMPRCLQCGGILVRRKFIDSWKSVKQEEPEDVNEDFYCERCDLRWVGEPGSHDFFEEEGER